MSIQVITSPLVDVTVTSTVSSFASERRFQKDLTIAGLKGKLELLTGGSSHHMVIDVYDKDNKLVCHLSNDDALLGSYPIDSGMRIHVQDKSGKLGEYEDLSKVEKLEMSKDEYDNRTDSVRAFKKRMKMGQFRDVDPEEVKRKEEEAAEKKRQEEEKAARMSVADRCETRVLNQPTKRGTVMYIGTTEFQPGTWVGVKYDEPLGKHDGSVKGKRYFECPPQYGAFVRPSQVETGDFPELGLEDDEMDEL